MIVGTRKSEIIRFDFGFFRFLAIKHDDKEESYTSICEKIKTQNSSYGFYMDFLQKNEKYAIIASCKI
jgi:hypothetical protein